MFLGTTYKERPLGSEDWIDKLTAMTGRELKTKKWGAKRKAKDGN